MITIPSFSSFVAVAFCPFARIFEIGVLCRDLIDSNAHKYVHVAWVKTNHLIADLVVLRVYCDSVRRYSHLYFHFYYCGETFFAACGVADNSPFEKVKIPLITAA